MPQNIFKIYDGRTSFWQWDTKQKLIVLDDRITEVRFSNRNMEHSKRRPVYTDKNGVRVCSIPDILLQLPKNLIAYACVKYPDGSCSTIKSVKFAVHPQPIPADYVCEHDAAVEELIVRLEMLEELIRDVNEGNKQFAKFNSMEEASEWVIKNGKVGDIVVVQLEANWIPYVVENDFTLDPICTFDGEVLPIVIDGGDADGSDDMPSEEEELVQYFDGGASDGKQEVDEEEVIQYFDGGSASGI